VCMMRSLALLVSVLVISSMCVWCDHWRC